MEIRVSGNWRGFDEITLLDDDTYKYNENTYELLGARVRIDSQYYQVDHTTWIGSSGLFKVYLVRYGDYDDGRRSSDDDINNAELQFIGSTKKTRYLMNRVKENTDYYFVLYAVGGGKASIWVQADPYPLAVEDLEKIRDTDEDGY